MKTRALRLVADLVEMAAYTAREAAKVGHLEGAPTVLTSSIVEWQVRRGGIHDHTGGRTLCAELN